MIYLIFCNAFVPPALQTRLACARASRALRVSHIQASPPCPYLKCRLYPWHLCAMTIRTYGLWANKGGVGKTTLCFHLSTAYAHLHPDEAVILVDMCPQANLSCTALTHGPGKWHTRCSALFAPSTRTSPELNVASLHQAAAASSKHARAPNSGGLPLAAACACGRRSEASIGFSRIPLTSMLTPNLP